MVTGKLHKTGEIPCHYEVEPLFIEMKKRATYNLRDKKTGRFRKATAIDKLRPYQIWYNTIMDKIKRGLLG